MVRYSSIKHLWDLFRRYAREWNNVNNFMGHSIISGLESWSGVLEWSGVKIGVKFGVDFGVDFGVKFGVEVGFFSIFFLGH